MPDLVEQIEAMTPDCRTGALIALDAVTRPLTVREIERALMRRGVTKSRATIIAASVKGLALVAVVGAEANSST